MAASYPTLVKAFTTKTAGQTVASAHVNDLQDEVVAMESDLLAGVRKVNYTWPAADGTANQALTTNGSAVLTWAEAGSVLAIEVFS